MASLTFNPVLAEVLKHLSNPLSFANFFNSCILSILFLSKRSALFSTKIQGNLFPSKNLVFLSIKFFKCLTLYKNI